MELNLSTKEIVTIRKCIRDVTRDIYNLTKSLENIKSGNELIELYIDRLSINAYMINEIVDIGD